MFRMMALQQVEMSRKHAQLETCMEENDAIK